MGFPIREGSLGSFTGTTTGNATKITDLDEVFAMISGTFVGTMVIEVSFDGGTSWVQFDSATAPKLTAVLPPCNFVRARCSAFTSGTIVVNFSGRNKAPGIS